MNDDGGIIINDDSSKIKNEPFVLGHMPEEEIDKEVKRLKLKHIKFSDVCTRLNLERLSYVSEIVYAHKRRLYRRRIGGRFKNKFLAIKYHYGITNKSYDTDKKGNNCNVIIGYKRRPKFKVGSNVAKWSNAETKKYFRKNHISLTDTDFNKIFIGDFHIDGHDTKPMAYTIPAFKIMARFCHYATYNWSRITMETCQNAKYINKPKALKLVPNLLKANTRLVDIINERYNDVSFKNENGLYFEACIDILPTGKNSETIQMVQIDLHSDQIYKEFGIKISSLIAIPIKEYNDKINDVTHKDSNGEDFTEDSYQYVCCINIDESELTFVIDDLQLPIMLHELSEASLKWLNEFKVSLLKKPMFYFRSNERIAEMNKINDKIKNKLIEQEKEKQKQNDIYQAKLKYIENDLRMKQFIRSFLSKMNYISTTEKVIRMVSKAELDMNTYINSLNVSSSISTTKVYPAPIIKTPSLIPNNNPSNPIRVGTTRALAGSINIIVIYPSGAEYNGRLRKTVCNRVVIEPNQPDTAAFICWQKDVMGMTSIHLKDIDYERIYHTEKGYEILNNLTYV